MANVTQGSFNQFISGTHDHFQKLVKEEIIYDAEVDSWMFMSSLWPIMSILSLYLLFVLKFGPGFMESRKPFSLKNPILLYNAFQTIFNAWIVSMLFTTPGAIHYIINHLCYPIPRHQNQFLLRELYSGSWFFFISKVFDLLDTVFFVLRKKQSQVTFLHVYHHVNMVFTTWAYLRFIKGEQLLLGAVINSFIHVIMYSYYFLSALGPHMQKYLWWKKYLTRLQIIQFIFIMGYNVTLYAMNCNMPKLFVFYIVLDVALFLYLFCLFYTKTYEKNKQAKDQDNATTKQKNKQQ